MDLYEVAIKLLKLQKVKHFPKIVTHFRVTFFQRLLTTKQLKTFYYNDAKPLANIVLNANFMIYCNLMLRILLWYDFSQNCLRDG